MLASLKLIPMQPSELANAFQIYKEALSTIVAEAFEWNEKFQEERFQTKYEPSWFYWIEDSAQKVALAAFFHSPLSMNQNCFFSNKPA